METEAAAEVEIIEEKTLQVQRTEASLEDVLSDGW
jgi:hypothetical protein